NAPTEKIENADVAATLRRIVRFAAPGPANRTAFWRIGRGDGTSIAPVTVKAMTCGAPAVAFTSVMACRSEPGPLSAAVETVNVAACAAPLASSPPNVT